MIQALTARANARTIPLHVHTSRSLTRWLRSQPAHVARWVKACGYKASPNAVCLVPAGDGSIAAAIVGRGRDPGPWAIAAGPERLPPGRYRLAEAEDLDPTDAAVGWALGSYRFDRYKSEKRAAGPTLVWPEGADRARARALASSISLGRDLINTTAADMGPAELATAARSVARKHNARCTVTSGPTLKRQYPTVHLVGAGCHRGPRLIDLRWGPRTAPKVTLVGKGVCFDSGGLDIKSAHGMKLMKKDMGGAAAVLSIAQSLMATKPKLRLRVLIPAVENAVSDRAMHPLDVVRTRSGITVEIGNTDAEGRLVLCDALHEAAREKPELIIDMATLTGAARIALGTDVPALFCSNDKLADGLLSAGRDTGDLFHRMPLHDGYRRELDSKVADLNNIGSTGYGGAITAALFLREFVDRSVPWAHIDTMGWHNASRPGRPQGGEVFGLRAIHHYLTKRFG